MMCGLQGAGKTTHAAKLADHAQKPGPPPPAGGVRTSTARRPSSSCRWWRKRPGSLCSRRGTAGPGAIIAQAGAYATPKTTATTTSSSIPPAACRSTRPSWRSCGASKPRVSPTDILLVVDAMTGQEAVNVAKTFDDLLDITGVILTKLDGDTRGGAAIVRQGRHRQAHQIRGHRRKARPTWRCSTPTAWPAVSWAWATCSPSSRRPS